MRFPRDRRPDDLDVDEDGYDRKAEHEADVSKRNKDQRHAFERDRDRLLYSREFRRLKDVTQVARAGESYLYHDRLTHSLKVGQVGRRLAELLFDVYTPDHEDNGDEEATEPPADTDGEKLADKEVFDESDLSDHLDPRVVETACLAHDIGHPPFGHVTEDLLDKKIRLYTSGHEAVLEQFFDGEEHESLPDGLPTNKFLQELVNIDEFEDLDGPDVEGFEGNAQSFRTVTKLGTSRSGVEGMNLTRATLNAMQKYPWGRDENIAENKNSNNKWGFYPSEKEYFEFARANTDENRYQVLEAELMDWADDLTYAVHDVEDFYRSGLIPLDILFRESDELYYEIPEHVRSSRNQIEPVDYADQFENHAESVDMQLHDFAEFVSNQSDVDADVSDVLVFFVQLRSVVSPEQREIFKTPYNGTQRERNVLNQFSSTLISRYIESRGPDPSSRSNIRVTRHDIDDAPTLSISDTYDREVGILKQLTFYYVISNSTLAGQQQGQIELIGTLFDELYAEATSGTVGQSAIIEPYREYIEELNDDMHPARVVADMITSMTETQAVDLYRRLTGDSPGSLQDDIMRK